MKIKLFEDFSDVNEEMGFSSKDDTTYHLDKVIKIYSIKYKGSWFEVHVDVTEDNILDILSKVEVTPEIKKYLKDFVDEEIR